MKKIRIGKSEVLAPNIAVGCMRIADMQNFEVLGKVSLNTYSQLLSISKVGISLMISPHPSYPPLEMAYYGLFVVTNCFQTKNLNLRSSNFISISDCTPEEIAYGLEMAINKSEKTPPEKRRIDDIVTSGRQYDSSQIAKLWGIF